MLAKSASQQINVSGEGLDLIKTHTLYLHEVIDHHWISPRLQVGHQVFGELFVDRLALV